MVGAESVGGAGAETLTETDADFCWPCPLHAKVNVVLEFNGPIVSSPRPAFEPFQPPEALQTSAFWVTQPRITFEPALTVMLFWGLPPTGLTERSTLRFS